MAVPDHNGQWHILTGNQLGIVLMDYLLARADVSPGAAPSLVISSLVSTPMAEAVAARYGAHIERTLTGFKWLWTAALELAKIHAFNYVLGWEEALGYSTHKAVRDKDGIAAALIAADWVAACLQAGILPWERLGQLYREHGAWTSRQYNIIKPGIHGAAEISAGMQRLASGPPSQIADASVVGFDNYSVGFERRPMWLGQADLLLLRFSGGGRIVVRPSGTEPKLKLYVDVPAEVSPYEEPFAVLQRASERADRMAQKLIDWLSL
jgi:phosphomannomutase